MNSVINSSLEMNYINNSSTACAMPALVGHSEQPLGPERQLVTFCYVLLRLIHDCYLNEFIASDRLIQLARAGKKISRIF